jgi:hypothetical protein
MRLCLARLSVALASAALLLAALPVSAKPVESQDNSFHTDLNRFASTLKAEGQRALTAAANAVAYAVHDGSAALVEAEGDAAKRLQEFRAALNERKARLGMIGEDAAERLETWKQTWKQETIAAWLDSWPDSWTDTMSAMHRSATGALDWFRDWFETPSASDKPTQIPV